MLKELLSEDMIRFSDDNLEWKEALRLAASPLLENHFVTENYVDRMVKNVEDYGPYIHITEGLALPHARPEDGALKNGLSLLVLPHPTMLLGDSAHPILVFICLACGNATIHIDIMSELTNFLTDHSNLKAICSARHKEDIIRLIV